MSENLDVKTPADVSIERLGRNGYLHRVIPIMDKAGNVIQRVVKPLEVEFRLRDVIQTIVGASILAIPAAYTEEAWNLGSELALSNIIGIAVLSITFIAIFVYYNFYKSYFAEFRSQFILRVVGTYLVSPSWSPCCSHWWTRHLGASITCSPSNELSWWDFPQR
jgi:uncharacterized membrane protein